MDWGVGCVWADVIVRICSRFYYLFLGFGVRTLATSESHAHQRRRAVIVPNFFDTHQFPPLNSGYFMEPDVHIERHE